MEKKIIVLVLVLFVLTAAMLVIPLNKSSSSSNKLVRISENVFTFDGYTILHLNNSGKQIYVYDNNDTLIPLSLYHKFENQVNNFITVNPDIAEFNYTIDSIQNFKTTSLSFYSSSYDYFTIAKAYEQSNLSNYYYILMIIIDFILMYYLKDRNIMAIFTVVYLLIISIFNLYNLGIAIFILFLYIYLKSKRLY